MATLSLHFSPPIRTCSFPTILACSNGVPFSKPRSNGGPVIMEIPLENIRRLLMRVRFNDPDKVKELMDSIRVIGLQVTIDVLEVDGVYYGFSGCDLYEAHQQLGPSYNPLQSPTQYQRNIEASYEVNENRLVRYYTTALCRYLIK